MSHHGEGEVRLVTRLIRLADDKDRGALAALRTGLGKPPGTAARMLPIVAPFLTSDDGPATRAAFLVAAIFAKHPSHDPSASSLGYSLWKSTKNDANPGGKHKEAGVETRVVAALDADKDDLQRHLEGLVSICESARQPINYHRLYRDVWGLLGRNERYQANIRTRWAREFWRGDQRSKGELKETDR
jgi:CRISPR system Cascade subunit CasB